MCSRYVRRSDKQRIAEYFHATPVPAELHPPGEDYNVAPTTFQPRVRQSRESCEREIALARWGLVPFFTKELSDIKACPPSMHALNPSPKLPLGANSRGNGAVSCLLTTRSSAAPLLRRIEMFEAHPSVGNVRNNGPEFMRKAKIVAESGVLPL